MTDRKIITKLPLNWPSDNRTKRHDMGDLIVIRHPDRETHVSEDGKAWRVLETAA